MSSAARVARPRAAPRPEDPPSALAGVGPRRARALERAGILSVRDLLLFAPRAVEPFPAACSIAACLAAPAGLARVAGRVAKRSFSRFGRRSLLRVALEDSTGRIDVLFFNQSWLRERFAIGAEVEVLGRAVLAPARALTAAKLGTAQHPLPAAGELVAEYPPVEGLTSAFLGGLCRDAARACAAELRDPLPATWLAARGLPGLAECARALHAPRDAAEFARAARRIALERALELGALVASRRLANAARRAPAITCTDAEERALAARFPFAFTAGQQRVAAELRDDLARRVPMRRLLQGDVGSGKTALGLYACLLAASAGKQAAFMAPTELLAEQHYFGLRELCEEAGVRTALLSGSLGAGERRSVLAELADGSAQIVFGTHALFSDDVRFAELALAVIDEQHRFGVEQRQRLAGKGACAHVLLMTATPIPRTLAWTVYGDLELSTLREKPPGRAGVETRWVRKEGRAAALARMRAALDAGEQLYWVVPRIGEAEDGAEPDAPSRGPSAEARFARLQSSDLARHGVLLVHGRLAPDERAARLDRFRRGEARILVATTVIEVGVDVPAATVIAIEGAERLGLAQLHQLRGRVGRSSRPSACFLYGKPGAAARFELLEQESDGFRIAEADLELRGMGELCGLRQAGIPGAELAGGEPAETSLKLARELFAADSGLAAEYLRAGPALDS